MSGKTRVLGGMTVIDTQLIKNQGETTP